MDTFTTVLSVFSTVCAIVFGYIALVTSLTGQELTVTNSSGEAILG